MFGQNAFNNFGNTNANTQPASQPTTGTSNLFGGFGQQANQNNQNQPGGNTGGSSLFGAPTAPATTTNSLFGAKPASTGSIFGNTSSTTQPASGGNSLFGGGLFGNNAQNTTNTGTPSGSALFGTNNASQSQPAAGAGLFGGQNQQQNTAQTGTSAPSLFGSSNLFGQKPPQNTQPAPSLFGQSQSQQPAQQQQTTFGQSFNSAPTPGLSGFGNASTSNQPLGRSLLGISSLGGSSNLLGPRATTGLLPSQQHQADTAQGQFTNLAQRIEGIEQAWNSNSPNCRFQV